MEGSRATTVRLNCEMVFFKGKKLEHSHSSVFGVSPADSWPAFPHALLEKKMKEAVMPFCWRFFQGFPSRWCPLVTAVPRRAEVTEFSKILWRQMPLACWEVIQVGRHGQMEDHEKVYDLCEHFSYFHKLVMRLCGIKLWPGYLLLKWEYFPPRLPHQLTLPGKMDFCSGMPKSNSCCFPFISIKTHK